MRRAVALLISTTVAALFLFAGTAQATKPFDGPEAGGATLAAAILTGFICWTVELAEGESYDDEEDIDVDDDFDRSGWFVGLQGVYAHENIDESKEQDNISESNEPFLVDFQIDTSEVGGVRGKIGRRCNSRLSVELQVEWIDSFKASISEAETGRTNNVAFDSMVGSIDVKGYLLTGRLQPFVMVGVGTMGVTTDSINTSDGSSKAQDTGLLVGRFGGGVDYYLTRNWVISAEADYVYAATNIQNLDYFSLGAGVTYRFD